jgi:hypothetical protein
VVALLDRAVTGFPHQQQDSQSLSPARITAKYRTSVSSANLSFSFAHVSVDTNQMPNLGQCAMHISLKLLDLLCSQLGRSRRYHQIKSDFIDDEDSRS